VGKPMKLFIFTKTKGAEKWFSSIKKGASAPEFHPPADLKKTEKNIPCGSIVYIDASSFKSGDLLKAIAPLAKRDDICFGIIDPKGSVADVAELFHKGAADYIGKDLIKKGVSLKRIESVCSFGGMAIDESASAKNSAFIVSDRNWKCIKQGREYTFCMMLVELDKSRDIKTSNFGGAQQSPSEIFRKFIDQQTESTCGKVWIWHDFGGVILFPFEGSGCEALLPALRMTLHRNIFSIEESIFTMPISFRIAIHIGNTVYKERGDTGNIVSDAINFIYHLGQKKAEAGSLYITSEAYERIPESFRSFFLDEGQFEGRPVFRMKRLG
jgi:hypothetical protein